MDKLEGEFIRFRDAFAEADAAFNVLRSVYEYNELVTVRKGMRNVLDMGPHPFIVTRTVEEQYAVAKRSLWNALNEFIEIYRQLG